MNYTDFQPKNTSRVREAIEWSTTYTYNSLDTTHPRVLLIGDSICNAYQSEVRRILSSRANVTFWASSKCVTDPDYFRELDFIAGAYSYSLICFNNGLHSLVTDRGEWVAAYRAAVDFLRAKLPDAKLLLLLCTALNDPVRNEIVKRINSDILKTAEEKSLATLDLFTPTDSLDKDKMMGDTFHYKPAAVTMQAELICEAADRLLGLADSGIVQQSTETGPLGRL